MKLDVKLINDCDEAEKRYENMVGMSSYEVVYTHMDLSSHDAMPHPVTKPSNHTQRLHACTNYTP